MHKTKFVSTTVSEQAETRTLSVEEMFFLGKVYIFRFKTRPVSSIANSKGE